MFTGFATRTSCVAASPSPAYTRTWTLDGGGCLGLLTLSTSFGIFLCCVRVLHVKLMLIPEIIFEVQCHISNILIGIGWWFHLGWPYTSGPLSTPNQAHTSQETRLVSPMFGVANAILFSNIHKFWGGRGHPGYPCSYPSDTLFLFERFSYFTILSRQVMLTNIQLIMVLDSCKRWLLLVHKNYFLSSPR